MRVAVIGPGDDASSRDLHNAYEVGRLLAERGCIVLTGGLGGVMAEAARGCTEAGGTCVGLLPDLDTANANEHLTLALPTGLGEIRNGLVVRAAEAVIAVGGSWGTLSEFALANRTGVRAVSLDGWRIAGADGAPIPTTTATDAHDAVAQVTA